MPTPLLALRMRERADVLVDRTDESRFLDKKSFARDGKGRRENYQSGRVTRLNVTGGRYRSKDIQSV